MTFRCPHCAKEFDIANPFDVAGDTACPLCGRPVYIEVDEGDEGPIFAIFKEMPPSTLYPPT